MKNFDLGLKFLLLMSAASLLGACTKNLGTAPVTAASSESVASGQVGSDSSTPSTQPLGAPGTNSATGSGATLGSGATTTTTVTPKVVAATVTSVAPFADLAAGGHNVTITGTNFATGASVTINGAACTNTTVVSATSVTCTVPAATAGTIAQVNVAVINPGTSAGTLPGGFFYLGAPVAWLKADTGVTVAGGLVSAWADQSGGANNATQTTAAMQPSFVAASTAFNNMPVISFAGAQQMNLANLAAYNNATGGTFAVAASTTQPTAHQAIVYNETATAGEGRFSAFMNSTCTAVGSATGNMGLSGRRLDSETACDVVAGGNVTASTAFSAVGTVQYVLQTSSLAVNGTVVSTSTTFGSGGGNTSPTNGLGAWIGSAGATSYLTGDVAEVLLYNTTITAAQQQALGAYLALRYGL